MLRAALNVQSSDAAVAIAISSEPRFEQHAALQARVAELEAQVHATVARSRQKSLNPAGKM
jgi:hypothetical protein